MLEVWDRCAALGCSWEKLRLCRSWARPVGCFRDGNTRGAVYPASSMGMSLRRRFSVHTIRTRACSFALLCRSKFSTRLLDCFDWPSSKLLFTRGPSSLVQCEHGWQASIAFPMSERSVGKPTSTYLSFPFAFACIPHVHFVAGLI